MTNLFNIDIDKVRCGGADIRLIKLGGNIIYEAEMGQDEGDFCIKYTVKPVDEYLNTSNEKYCIGLPRIYSTRYVYSYDYSKIEIKKIDGTITSDPMTKCNEIEEVTVWYPEETYGINFHYSSSSGLIKPVIESVKYCNISNFVSMEEIFVDCVNLTEVNTSNWNTSKITNMSTMFEACHKLTSIDVSNFNTSNVTSMTWMFYSCQALQSLDVSSFDTSKITSMMHMFGLCKSLRTITGLSNFDTSNVTDMRNVFNSCTSLIELDLSNWDTSKLTNMTNMFYNCASLQSLDLSSWDVSKVTEMGGAFNACPELVNFKAPKNISVNIAIDSSTKLSHDSLMSVINNLATVTETKTFSLTKAIFAKLSEEDKAIATNKGWIVKQI